MFWSRTVRTLLLPMFLVTLLLAACNNAPAASSTPPQEATAAPTVAAAEEGAAQDTPAQAAAPASADAIPFVIDPARSVVRFTLTEDLRGVFTVVVGEGNGVSGGVDVDLNEPSATTIRPIEIDASTLATDNGMRNQAIGRFVLQHNQAENRIIRFVPTALSGLPESAAVGEPFEFSVTGDLTIRTVTRPVTFAMTVTPLSEVEIQGSGVAEVLRSDFDLQIPSVPSVANVSDEVTLEIEFVAVAAQ